MARNVWLAVRNDFRNWFVKKPRVLSPSNSPRPRSLRQTQPRSLEVVANLRENGRNRSSRKVAVRAGAPKPDVSSDAFKRALLTARSVAYLKEGQSGVYVAAVLERLGIAETIRSKLTLPETDIVSELVSRGEIELGIVVITQIVTTDGVALAGPLPAEIQSYISFTGGICANSKLIDAAKDLMTVLKSPMATGVMRSQGIEPGK